jgi:hypothetical protein
MSHLHLFPSRFVYTETLDNHQVIKDLIFPIIKAHAPGCANNADNGDYYEKTGHICSFNMPGNEFLATILESCGILDSMIWQPFDRLLSQPELKLSKFPKSRSLGDIWYNVHEPNSMHERHTHLAAGASFCGIYILELKEENTTSFHQEGCEPMASVYTTEHLPEGSLILFPSDLLHEVGKNKSFRSSIAFDINCEF